MGDYNGNRSSSENRSFGRRDFGNRDTGRSFDKGGYRPMCKAICSTCGKDCEVPFKPTNGKPVYCSVCFGKIKNSRQDSPLPVRPDFRVPVFDQSKNQLDSINTKLDKILKLLEPKIPITIVSAEIKEVKAPKVKKATKKSTELKTKESAGKISVSK